MSESEVVADPASPTEAGNGELSAGALLRKARQAQGMHIAALAAAIKVTPQKLEALEADRHEELPDATFVRALAQTVCRTLKIDPEPVLAKLPRPAQSLRLEEVTQGLKMPFKDRNGRGEGFDAGMLLQARFWAPLLLLVAAALVWLLPPEVKHLMKGRLAAPQTHEAAQAASAASAAVAASMPEAASGLAPLTQEAAPVPGSQSLPPAVMAASTPAPATPAAAREALVQQPAAVAPEAANPSASEAASQAKPVAGSAQPGGALPSGALQLRTTEESWVEIRDGNGKLLVSRQLAAGESVALSGATPLRLRIGNPSAAHLSFRGKPVDLAPYTTRDNLAKLELK